MTGEQVRRLYAAVFIQSVKDAATAGINGHREAIADFEAWLRSSDGREVANRSGIDLTEAAIRAFAQAISEAVRYRNPYLFSKGGRRSPA